MGELFHPQICIVNNQVWRVHHTNVILCMQCWKDSHIIKKNLRGLVHMDAEKLGAFYMVDPRAFSYRVKVLRGSSHTPGGFLQIFGRCFPTYTHIIRFEYEANRMDSKIFCHECNGVFVLQFFRSSWAMTSKALPPLFVEVPGPRRDRFLCVISGNRLSLGSNHCITAS